MAAQDIGVVYVHVEPSGKGFGKSIEGDIGDAVSKASRKGSNTLISKIGGAFGKITTSLVNDIIMPLISMLTGGVDFSAWKWVLKEAVMEGSKVVTPEIAVNYGNLIAVILDFIIIAFAVFCMVKAINKMHDKLSKPAEPESEKAPEPTKEALLLAEIRDLLKEQSK